MSKNTELDFTVDRSMVDMLHNWKAMSKNTKLDFTKPETLQRRDGGEFRILATDIPGEKSVCIAMKDLTGSWFLKLFDEFGVYSRNAISCYDIIPKPERVTKWCAVYRVGKDPELFFDPPREDKQQALFDLRTHTLQVGVIYIDTEVQQ